MLKIHCNAQYKCYSFITFIKKKKKKTKKNLLVIELTIKSLPPTSLRKGRIKPIFKITVCKMTECNTSDHSGNMVIKCHRSIPQKHSHILLLPILLYLCCTIQGCLLPWGNHCAKNKMNSSSLREIPLCDVCLCLCAYTACVSGCISCWTTMSMFMMGLKYRAQ